MESIILDFLGESLHCPAKETSQSRQEPIPQGYSQSIHTDYEGDILHWEGDIPNKGEILHWGMHSRSQDGMGTWGAFYFEAWAVGAKMMTYR